METAWHVEPDMLDVSDGHRLYLECSGPADGVPVLVLHGGPGSGFTDGLRALHAGHGRRLILVDQRGAGRSLPEGALHANDTASLVEDIERVRAHLGVRRWIVAGGSWGASLAVAWAAAHPEAVAGLVLRNPFLTGRDDVMRFLRGDALPQGDRDAFRAAWPDDGEPPASFARLLARGDTPEGRRLALAWRRHEARLAGGTHSVDEPDEAGMRRLLARYRVQAHYLSRDCDLGEARLLALARGLRGLGCTLLQGAVDRVCPPAGAIRLREAIGDAALVLVPGAGHDPFHPGMQAAIARALDDLVEREAACGP